MKTFLLTFLCFGIITLVYSKIVFEKMISNANPDYVKWTHEVKEVDGEQYTNMDLYVLQDVIPAPKYVMTVSRKENDEYQDFIKMGPMDICEQEISSNAYKQKHHEHVMKHGNMSIHHVCPFAKGYYYIRDMKVDFTDELPPKMTPGQYKMEMQSFTEDNVQIFDEQFFMRIE